VAVAVPKQAKAARLARFHFALGRMLASLSAPGWAALALRDAVRAEPRLAAAHFALGEALGRVGRWGEAAAAYAAAARLRCDTEYQGNLVFALGRAFLWQEALQACDRFGLSEDAEVLLVRGLILRRLGRANESILAFRRAVQIPARAAGRRFFLGEALFGGEVWQSTLGAHLQARGVRQKHAFGSRLNTAPARGKPVPQPKCVAPRRHRLADLAPALRRVARAGLRAAWRSWQELRRGPRHAGLLLARLRYREPHHTLRALRSAQRLDGVRYFSSARPTAHT
jgi:tetratricopeptide (TPR) repeat protein